MIRKQRVVAHQGSRKIVTGYESKDYYENELIQSEKRNCCCGRKRGTNDRSSDHLKHQSKERSRSRPARNQVHPGTNRFFGTFEEGFGLRSALRQTVRREAHVVARN